MGALEHGSVNKVARSIVAYRVDLLRLEAHTRAQVLQSLDQMGLELERQLARAGALTSFSKARLNRLLAQTGDTIESYYARAQDHADNAIDSTVRTQAAHATDVLSAEVSTDVSLPTAATMAQLADDTIIMGAPSATWWARQSQDTTFKFAAAVRQGILAGETNEQIVRKVVGSATQPGILQIAKRNARTLVHSSIQTVANRAAIATYNENDDVVEGMQQLSTLDDRTTDICIAYGSDGADGDGAQWDMDGNPLPGTDLPFLGGPPRHWNCRSVLVPITTSFKKLGVDVAEMDPGMRASSEGPTSNTFEEWLQGRTEEQQDEQLGAGRAQLWRDGRITLQQLLDMHGNPLTTQQLERRYGGG